MILTKKELTQRLINGEKLKPKSYTDDGYCCYDESYIEPFRHVSIPSLYSTPMLNAWEHTEWEVYKEILKWEPEGREAAYYISVTGKVTYGESDKNTIKQGNVFKIKEEAEKEAKLRAAKYKVKKRIWELNGGKFIKFKRNGPNWSFGLDRETLEINNFYHIKIYPNWQCLKSKELVQQLINEMRDDLLLIRNE